MFTRHGVQRHVRCESLQEGKAVQEKSPVFASRLEDAPRYGHHDDGLARAKLAVFISGGGSNFKAIHAGCKKNTIHGDVAYVVSDKPGCKGVEYANENEIPVLAYPKGKNAPEGISPTELVENLRQAGVEYILLAGYLRLLPTELVHAYPRAILNIHPALLPSFGGKGYYGMKVHEAVIRSGARYTGATVHFVDEKYDTGPILAQRVVPVRVDETATELASRVLKEEHKLYSFAVSALCEDRIFWREDGVPIIRKSWDEAEYL
jgi:phosphoribosylglycinamide formyltransferase